MRYLVLAAVLVAVPTACQRGQAPSPQQTSTSARPEAAAPKIARVVFIDLEYADEGTRKRIEGAWKVLHEVLGTPSRLPLARVNFDTEPARVERFKARDPKMVPPALCFVDEDGVVLDVVHGEITAERLLAVLEKK